MARPGSTVAASDESLLAAFLAGDDAAGDGLLSRHRDAVLQFIRWYVGDGAQAEDLTQDVFVQVLRSARGFRGRSSFRTWLFAVARHVCLRHARTRDRRPATGGGDDTTLLAVPDPTPDVLAVLADRDQATAVRTAVAALPPHLGTALLLREWEGMSYEEMAEVLEIPVGTVRSRLHHARAALLADLAPLRGETTWQT